ncbi:hypothetical protein [Chryseobacterium sp.]|nr:hypothetical protein [Chryseobacterium sp.]
MRKAILLFPLVLFGTINAQVGINTPNPQGIFHADEAKDNLPTGNPTISQ